MHYCLIFPPERLWAVKGVLEALTQEKPLIIKEWVGRGWNYYTEKCIDPEEFVTIRHYTGAEIFEIK